MIRAESLTKRYGDRAVVDDLSFEVVPGRVTGLLGPNGAGKTTTLRMILGLVHPDAGDATIDGRRYEQLEHPSGTVGAVLEDASFHPGRTAVNHLRVLDAAGRHPPQRVEEALTAVGLNEAANKRVKGYSMGMRQRLAIAAALLGEPEVLILDEPTNGLDPGGIRWMRDLIRHLAGRGNTVLLSSHLLTEVALSVDDVVVISNGLLRASGPLMDVLGAGRGPSTRVRSREADRLLAALHQRDIACEIDPPDTLLVDDASPEDVGLAAAENGIALIELGPITRTLEDTFFELTGGEQPGAEQSRGEQ